MGKLFLGGPLNAIKDAVTTGLQPGQILRHNLLDAMLDARNAVGLNRRFRPAVLVVEKPSNAKLLQQNDNAIAVLSNFLPMVSEVLLLKIDFNAPRLVRVAGTLSPLALFDIGSRSKQSYKRMVR
ncbi:hypothetical protein [Desulforamulus hydrothermalis]|uniref:Uncharacterized protein n=1 Tax=Desulforamulus hydrothermalis Lam5 = DSM 18033 TaxID=1121428 RepID=K8EJN0_9FIRM|nr:hypothetical protein [Desulforamulus hydrothermalis]CCO08776.1 conserved hypothetical protein [Desulforamulus hydrothermalis Lam5 = DSM 18033]SHG71225.1 hypothetical protein SAMN02745177_00088 [Desulforamulus hydrothermalis Lam5 = DSM 18033]